MMRAYRNNQQILAQARRLYESGACERDSTRKQVLASLTGALNRRTAKAPTVGRGADLHRELAALHHKLTEMTQSLED